MTLICPPWPSVVSDSGVGTGGVGGVTETTAAGQNGNGAPLFKPARVVEMVQMKIESSLNFLGIQSPFQMMLGDV